MKVVVIKYRLNNFIRGITFHEPCARTLNGEQVLAVLKAELIQNAPNYIGTCGEVIGKNDRVIVLKSKDNSILITEVADVVNDKLTNIRCPKHRIGTRFGLNLLLKIRQLEERISELEKC